MSKFAEIVDISNVTDEWQEQKIPFDDVRIETWGIEIPYYHWICQVSSLICLVYIAKGSVSWMIMTRNRQVLEFQSSMGGYGQVKKVAIERANYFLDERFLTW